MTSEWRCRVLEQDLGPMTWTDLKALAGRNELLPHDLVREGALGKWIPAHAVSGLFSKLNTA